MAKQFTGKSLAMALALHVKGKHPQAPVFAIRFGYDLADTLKVDLERSRKLWQQSLSPHARVDSEASDFLAALNHDGAHLDFHSLRHTCGAWLAMAGEHPKTVQTVMRHGTITLTMNTYGHLFPGQAEGAVDKLSAMMAG
jgi:hypothetical protein